MSKVLAVMRLSRLYLEGIRVKESVVCCRHLVVK